MGNQVISITDPDFDTEVLQANQPVLMYFWASWCGPCRLVSPSIEAIATTYGDRLKVVKMEVDPNPETVKRFQIQGVPALVLLKAGSTLEKNEGAISKAQLESMVLEHLPELSAN
ncbi:MAG: thioredoxin [Cyanothece sp. SIO1E1]|nr:thioredoxin [Cyanothece sp. SIO1E1]